jgi:hypothetical protein
MFAASALYAIRQSVCHGNTTSANQLLKLLPLVTRTSGAKQALIKYLEKWGRVHFDSSAGQFRLLKKHTEVSWTDEYESQVRSESWTDYLTSPAKQNSKVVDADKEFRKVLDRLKGIAADPTKTVLHSMLVSKVQEVIYAYGRSHECRCGLPSRAVQKVLPA